MNSSNEQVAISLDNIINIVILDYSRFASKVKSKCKELAKAAWEVR